MLKDQISKKGLLSAPEELEIDILLYASQKMNKEEKTDLLENISWLPFAGLFLILRDLFSGQKVSITPEVII